MGNTILIAGYGYLGETLASVLQQRGDFPIGLTKSDSTGSNRPSNPVYSCDISDPDALSTLRSSIPIPDVVVHCASSGRGGPEAYRSVFVEGPQNLAQAFPDARLFLTSSTSVYPQTDGSVVTENSPAQPDRETGKLLRQGEDIVLGNGGTVLRLAGIYGPNRSVHLKRFLEGTATIESGETSRFLNQIHRDDAVSAMAHLLNLDPTQIARQIFNVSDGDPLTQRTCYEKLAVLFDRPVPPEARPDLNRKRAWTHKLISNEKLRGTGWNPQYPGFLTAVERDPDLLPSIRDQISQP